MSFWTLVAVAVLYTIAGIDLMYKGQWAWGIMWCSYTVAIAAWLVATK